MKEGKHASFLKFVLLFLGLFAFFYYGAIFLTGLTVPGGRYSPFAERYLNIAAFMRTTIIGAAKMLLSVFGMQSYRVDEYVLRSATGNGIRIVYSCLGFGVMSFWAAYIIAGRDNIKRLLLWLFGGLLSLFLINVVRIALVLASANSGRQFPFGLDHHTWFNIAAYLLIFIMIYFEQTINKK